MDPITISLLGAAAIMLINNSRRGGGGSGPGSTGGLRLRQ